MGKKSGPPPPDYTAAAEKTAASNQQSLTDQTWANRPTQIDPWGQTSWQAGTSIDPSTGKRVTNWTQRTTLDPNLQAALDSQINVQRERSQMAEGLLGRVQNEYSQPMNWGQLSGWGQGAQAGNLQATTNPYGFGPQQQNIDTSRQGTPGLETGMGQQQALQRSLNFGGVQDVQGSAQNRQRAEDAIYQSATSRLNPQWQKSQTDMETQLAQQGISRNSEAYSRAMDDFNRQKTDAYQQASMGAITGGGAEAQRNFGMDSALRAQQTGEIGQQGQFYNQAAGQYFNQDLQGAQARNAALQAGYGMDSQSRQQQLAAQQAAYGQALQGGQFDLNRQNQAFAQQQAAGGQNFNQQMAMSNYQNQMRQQQLQEEIAKRGFSLNEMQALMSGQQVNSPQFCNFSQAGNAGGVDYSGAANSQYGAAMQQQQNQNAAFGDILGAGSSIASMFKFSDTATKRVLRRLGTHARGFGIYLFRYWGETLPRIGVVAQEVQRHAPELVARHRSGLLMVDYSRI